MTKTNIANDISSLVGHFSTREDKYRRNFNRFVSNGHRSENIWQKRVQPLTYNRLLRHNDVPTYNIIRSSINTIISKLSQTKVRPFFNPINGTYKTQRVCRDAQIFFDEYFDQEKIYSKAVEAVKDAAIFEYGAMWIDDATMEIKLLKPWEYYFDPAELQEGKLTRCFVRKKEYPISYLKDIIQPRSKKNRELAETLKKNRNTYVNYTVYYDLLDHKKYHIINGNFVKEESITYDIPPVVMIWYDPPVKGGTSTSIVDNLYDIQRAIDMFSYKIHKNAELSPSNQIFVPKGSGIKKSMVTNDIGKIYEYQPIPGVARPIEVSTPPVIDPTYIQLLEMNIQFAYNMEGISELSAQSKKPSGLNSGVALQTMEDVESERHNVILQNYIHFMMGIAVRVIEIFDDKENIIPKKIGRSNVKWKDLKSEREQYSIQFSASNILSKDPKVKMEQIEKLMSMNLIPPAVAATFLELPDEQAAYSIMNAAYDQVQKIIERAVNAKDINDSEAYEFYEVVDLNMLYRQIVNTIMRLDANDEDTNTISKLIVLLVKVKNQIDAVDQAVAEVAPIEEEEAPMVEEEAPMVEVPEVQPLVPGGMPAGMPAGEIST